MGSKCWSGGGREKGRRRPLAWPDVVLDEIGLAARMGG